MMNDDISDNGNEEWDDDNDVDDGNDEYGGDKGHVQVSFQSILQTLQSPITNQQQAKNTATNMKDPKAIRLAAVTCAIADIVQATTSSTNEHTSVSTSSTSTTITAAQVYAQAITALEGTLKVTLPNSTSSAGTNMIDVMMDIFATTNAILELLCITIPHISSSTANGSNIIAHTLQSFTTRIFRAVIQSTISFATTQLGGNVDVNSSTTNSNGGPTAVLRNICRASTILLQHVPVVTNHAAVQQFLQGTLLQLFDSETPKVRKAAQSGLLEAVAMSNEQHKVHPSIIKTLNIYVNKELQSMITKYDDKQTLQRCLHLLPFLERTIYFLNYQEISHSIMIFLTTLQQSMISNNSTTNDFVTVKVKESTPKVLVMASILNLVLCMLEQEQHGDDAMAADAIATFIHQFAQRVIATLLQIKTQFLYSMSTTNVEYDICEKTKLLYGQVMIASLQQQQIKEDTGTGHKSIETFSTLLPLSIQAIVQLCKPTITNIPQHKKNDTSAMIPQTLFIELTQLIRTKVPMLMDIIEPSTDSITKTKQSPILIMITKCCHDILQCMNNAILCDTAYRSTWSISLPMISILLQNFHSILPNEEISSIVESFIVLHNDSTTATANKKDTENALSTLLQGVGIETFWSWITWNDTISNDFSPSSKSRSNSNCNTIIAFDRAWVLSMMKSASSNRSGVPPRLEFFQKNVLELARQCDTLSKQSKLSTTSIRNASRTRVVELWNLFPCFCSAIPADIVQVLPSLNVTLGRVLEDKRYPELLTVICHGLTAMVKSFEEIDADEREAMFDERNALGDTAKSLIPILFKFVTDTHEAASSTSGSNKNDMDVDEKPTEKPSSTSNPIDRFQKLQCVSDAISALARLAPDGFMKVLFKKLMQRLLDEVQSEACDNERICAYLTLAQALVASKVLDESNSISFLYRALKPLITNHTDGSSARVQKRAYKVLNEICERYHNFVTSSERLNELSGLLTATIGTSQVSARYMRLKCLTIIVDGFDEANKNQLNEIYQVIPEVLLCLKDSNRKTRDAAYQLVVSMAVRGNIVEFVKVTLAALGSETSHMRSAVVMALSRLVFEQGWANDEFHALLPSLLKTILVLINEGSREVIKSVVGFVRICVAAIPAEQLEPLVPELIGSLLKSQHAKSRFRAKIKMILKKLVKLYGYEALMPHVPSSETRLLSHMRKLDEREHRKKIASRNERADALNRPNLDNYDAMFESDEDDSDEGRTLMTGATGLTRRTKQLMTMDDGKSLNSKRSKTGTVATGMTSKSKLSINPNLRLPNEADGEVVDLLSSSISKKVQFQSQYDNDSDDDDDDSAEMMFDDDGKLVVRDDDDDDDRKSTTVEMDEIIPMQGNNKRQRLMSSSSSLNSKGQSSQSSGGSNKMKKKNGNKIVPSIGASYQSKKAGGDVKKKGQMYEPYAYMPLDGRAYTKKHRRTTVEQMSTVVRNGSGSGNKGGQSRSNYKNNKRKR